MFFKNPYIKIFLFSVFLILLVIVISAYFTNYSTFSMSKGKKPAPIRHGEWMEYRMEPENKTIFYYSLGQDCYRIKIENASFDYCINKTGIFPDPLAYFYLPVIPYNNRTPSYYAQFANISGYVFEIDSTHFYYSGETEYIDRPAYIIKTNKNTTYLVDKEKEIAVFIDFGQVKLNLTNSSFLQRGG